MDSYAELHDRCAKALKVYMREAQKTCDVLGARPVGPRDRAERELILAQRQKENEAHESYQQARRALIDAAKLGIPHSS
jgi:hypothetical protein